MGVILGLVLPKNKISISWSSKNATLKSKNKDMLVHSQVNISELNPFIPSICRLMFESCDLLHISKTSFETKIGCKSNDIEIY